MLGAQPAQFDHLGVDIDMREVVHRADAAGFVPALHLAAGAGDGLQVRAQGEIQQVGGGGVIGAQRLF